MSEERARCGAETASGSPCRRWPKAGEVRCRSHADAEVPAGDAPAGVTSAAALELWSQVRDTFDLMPQELPVLREVVRVVDRLEQLAAWTAEHGVLDGKGRPAAAVVEARQQEIVLGRLLVTLRLPEDWEDDASRPQQRGGARGSYGPRSLAVVGS